MPFRSQYKESALLSSWWVFQGVDDIEPGNIFTLATYKSTRNQGNELGQSYCKTDKRKFSFSNRIVENWNKLPKEIKEAKSVNAFKNRMDSNQKLVELFYSHDERGY